MKTGLFLTALVQLAAAQPHNRHARLHEKREVVTQVATATAPYVVYANPDGTPYTTSYYAQAAAATAPAHHHHKNVHHEGKNNGASSHTVQQVNYHAQAGGSSDGSSGGSKGGHHSGLGIVYSPYNGDNTCKSQQQVNDDFAKIGDGYSMVRIYGVDCDQVNTVKNAAPSHMKLFLGVFDLSDVQGDLQMMISAIGNDWDRVDTVNIGNELVNSGSNSASEVVAQLGPARSTLRQAGYNGPVVTVDTFNAIISNPELCAQSDYAAANAHAFFNPTVSAPGAGQWVSDTKNDVERKCGKHTVITESGWPHAGMANGQAVPGPAQQSQAISSIRSKFSSGLVLYTAFDDLWKPTSPDTFNAEKYWGMLSGQ